MSIYHCDSLMISESLVISCPKTEFKFENCDWTVTIEGISRPLCRHPSICKYNCKLVYSPLCKENGGSWPVFMTSEVSSTKCEVFTTKYLVKICFARISFFHVALDLMPATFLRSGTGETLCRATSFRIFLRYLRHILWAWEFMRLR